MTNWNFRMLGNLITYNDATFVEFASKYASSYNEYRSHGGVAPYVISIERGTIIYSRLLLSSPSHPHPATTASTPPKALYPGFPVATGKHAGFTLSDQLIGVASSSRAISSTYLPHLWPGCNTAFMTLSCLAAGTSGALKSYSPKVTRNCPIGILFGPLKLKR